jgi:hypothetical protein
MDNKIPEKDIKEIGGGNEVVLKGKEALSALKAWLKGLKSCAALSSTRHNPAITFLLPHPVFSELGDLSIPHVLPIGQIAHEFPR